MKIFKQNLGKIIRTIKFVAFMVLISYIGYIYNKLVVIHTMLDTLIDVMVLSVAP